MAQPIAGGNVRQKINFDLGWKFHLGQVDGAERSVLDESGWRDIQLPHDFSIEGKFSGMNASGTAYLPGGIGWYRKTFTLPEADRGKKISIYFGGVYEKSEVWINGHYLGYRPYGYISFYYDMTPFLNYGEQKNTIAVRVDNSITSDSRWYTGSGIYRHVWLRVTSSVHIKQWSTTVTTPSVNDRQAQVKTNSQIINESDQAQKISLEQVIINPEGNQVAKSISHYQLQSGQIQAINHLLTLEQPDRWSIDHPVLYKLKTIVESEQQVLDVDTTTFGIRGFHFDANKGFFLNGKSVTIKGVCLHHDAGALGAAVPDREWVRRLKIMKEMGANAIRTSHNPPSQILLDLADQMGFLVMDEAFDEWELGKKKWIQGRNVGQDLDSKGYGKYYDVHGYSDYFRKWSKRDIQDMVRRDRNHPSIILWSIGNEVDYPNDPYADSTRSHYEKWRPSPDQLADIARVLYHDIKEIDRSRPVTAALANTPVSNKNGYAELLDVAGYNYQEQYYDQDHHHYPGRKIIGSENGDSYRAWKAVTDNDFVSGQFLWTGFDYLGEAGRFPTRSSASGLVSLSDFKKTGFYFRQSLWSDKPMVYLATIAPKREDHPGSWSPVMEYWNWSKYKGKEITVIAYTNSESVELYLNGKSMGTQKLTGSKNHVLRWEVPFTAGTLRAVAYNNGKEIAHYELKTAGKPSKIVLKSDRKTIGSNQRDIANIEIQVLDKNGIVVPDADNEVSLTIDGPARNIGLDNGDHQNVNSYKDNNHRVYKGKARMVIRSTGDKGTIHVLASAPGLKEATVEIQAQ